MKREVKFKDEGIGFSISCADCPLLPALETLGQKPRPCVSGIMTNMQGPVPVAECEHYGKNSIANEEGNRLSIECGKESA